VRRVCADSGAAPSAVTYASNTATNPSSRSTGARPRLARVFSEANSGRFGSRFCAFSEATPGVYFRERYFSEVWAGRKSGSEIGDPRCCRIRSIGPVSCPRSRTSASSWRGAVGRRPARWLLQRRRGGLRLPASAAPSTRDSSTGLIGSRRLQAAVDSTADWSVPSRRVPDEARSLSTLRGGDGQGLTVPRVISTQHRRRRARGPSVAGRKQVAYEVPS
jgi:hypothetical protein